MKIRYTAYSILILSLFIPGSASSELYADDDDKRINYTTNKFFVKTKEDLRVSEATGQISTETGISSIDEKNRKYKITKIERVFKLRNIENRELYAKLGMSRIYLFHTDEKSIPVKEMADAYNRDKFSEYSEPNYIGRAAGKKGRDIAELNSLFSVVPNDEMLGKQWYLNNDGSVRPSGRRSASRIGADINMLKGWQIETGDREVIVAILDSGVKDDHPDLRSRIWINTDEIPNNGRDDDGNGYIDDYKGWNFAYENNDPSDGFGHGTNIATVIGASTNNAIGFAGIDHNCRLMNLKNLSDDNFGEYAWWAESIEYAVDNGADIINMSEGGDDYSRTLETAVEYAVESGKLIAAAMMNKGNNKDYYPASFKGVFAVGATDTDDNRCLKFSWGGGSCWGKHISVVAPGNKIYGLDYEDNYDYSVFWSGTSQSTAIVSGLAALLLAQDNSRSSKEIEKIIMATARDRVGDPSEDTKGWDQYYGYGRVDGYLALTYGSSPELMTKIKEVERDQRNNSYKREDRDNTNRKVSDDGGAKAVDDKKGSTTKDSNANNQTPKPSRGR